MADIGRKKKTIQGHLLPKCQISKYERDHVSLSFFFYGTYPLKIFKILISTNVHTMLLPLIIVTNHYSVVIYYL